MQPLDPENRATSLWDYKKVSVVGTFNDPSDAFNYMYQYHLQAAKVKDDIAHNRSPMINTTHKASLPKLYEARAACIYKPDGKCIGMMNPERFHHLRERFHEAQKTDYTEKLFAAYWSGLLWLTGLVVC